MLVLFRRLGEGIVLDGGIRVVLLTTSRDGARIGIEAPDDVRVLRDELVGQPPPADPGD